MAHDNADSAAFDFAGAAFLFDNEGIWSPWAASAVRHLSQPDTTITGPTLDVTATTNYSADTIDNVTAITFETSARSVATFSWAQFKTNWIAANTTITGDSNVDTMDVHVGSGKTFDGSQLQFSNWTASDKFEIVATGDNATITGTSANDLINMGANFDATDAINGGAGSNTLLLDGNYSPTYLNVTSSMLQNVDTIDLTAGHIYSLNIENGVVGVGKTMTIDAAQLGSGDQANLYLVSDTTGRYVIDLGGGENSVNLNNSQVDIIHCGGGDNEIAFSGVLLAQDRIYGAGNTAVLLYGDYSAGYAFGANQLSGEMALYLQSGYGYKLTMNNANVAAGSTMVVNGESVDAAHSFIFNGWNVTGGGFDVFGGAGYDQLTGGAQDDGFQFVGSAMLTAADRIDGGGGSFNTVTLDGDYSAGLKLENATIQNIQQVYCDSGYSVKLTMAAGNVAAGQSFQIYAGSLSSANTLNFNGSALNADLTLVGGAGNDTLVGGSGTNFFHGRDGADVVTAGGSANTFDYANVGESVSTGHDTIIGFNALTDKFEIDFGRPSAVDATVTSGTLSSAHFDADLTTAIGANQLHAGDAVLFTPTTGNLVGHVFLIVDGNGTAGYQARADLVVELTSATNLSHFGLSDFT